ncbi:MAG: phosphoribosyl-AMP cyclohydrolase [Pseudomonadota bacterium]|nr:phosphoribosyl-AMP cyclohydrolase [Pseudomonadota bacterium]
MTAREESTVLADVVRFNADGLIPAIAQDADNGQILMMAWMNAEALAETLRGGQVCYWSRSRGALWRKGETSGHVQELVDLSIDCDGDTILIQVRQTGSACHTHRRSCFYRRHIGEGRLVITDEVMD